MRMTAKFILIIAFISALLSCSSEGPQQLVLFDFESDSELDRFDWKCHTLFSLSEQYVTHGARSLRLELYPSPYPGLDPMLENRNWKGYKAFCFDIYNTGEKDIVLKVRIDDRADCPNHEDRYNNTFLLKQGHNTLTIPLDSLVTSGTKRTLDLGNICKLLIFMGYPQRKTTLYIDHIRLVT